MTAPTSTATRPAILAILGISLVATLFLFWLIYVHPAADPSSLRLTFLPALNALLNGLSAMALMIGFVLIRARKIQAHRAAMLTAFAFSALFLVSYIVNHALHGESHYPQSPLRTFYLILLVSHILLSVVALPMILITFFFSLSGRIPNHRRIARWTFPVWLYVSVTGVIVYAMLAAARA